MATEASESSMKWPCSRMSFLKLLDIFAGEDVEQV